ncbi:Protein of unknown function (DUF1572) [Saprospira grandis DSM 2844]|uniref:DUF1572 domain-containing protein n=1 Tax=Saprospira grandis DSM 2844 TaxID=694433 RepID=J0XXZ2_9BACT|nr:DUF1572 family protein [Saprospira grandis]EJF53986.1 Protein of unknown function (DUF1572) [Saprospira grandis DSM 2844]
MHTHYHIRLLQDGQLWAEFSLPEVSEASLMLNSLETILDLYREEDIHFLFNEQKITAGPAQREQEQSILELSLAELWGDLDEALLVLNGKIWKLRLLDRALEGPAEPQLLELGPQLQEVWQEPTSLLEELTNMLAMAPLPLEEEEDDNPYTVQELALFQTQMEFKKIQFRQYKALGERAMQQLPEAELFRQFSADQNSIAIIVQHLWGNMRSRWTDFLNTDGEKDWRNRDNEFELYLKDRKGVMDYWEEGWLFLFNALDQLKAKDWDRNIYIHGEEHYVWQAIDRQLAHYSYHIGQIVLFARIFKQDPWESLSIPRGKSEEYNQMMREENERED